MRRFSAIILWALTLFAISCNRRPTAGNDEFIVNGCIANLSGNRVYLYEITPVKTILKDSIKADVNGQFRFASKLEGTGLYDVKFSKTNFIRILVNKGETIELTGDNKDLFRSYKVRGSEGSELLKELNEKFYRLSKSLDSLTKLFKDYRYSANFQVIKVNLDSSYRKTCSNYKKDITNFIAQHSNSLASIVAIYQKIGQEDLFNMNDEKDFEIFKMLDNELIAKYVDNMHVIEFHKSISEHMRFLAERNLATKNLELGAKAPDISLPNVKGEEIKLSSFRGKVVLLDFWASWCKPCRLENKELVRFYNKYKGNDFTIYSVSLDKEKEAWEKGIKDDKIKWIQVSDLQYWHSPLVNIFNIEGIPYSILLDKKGRIVGKGLSGKALEDKIKEQLAIDN
jgi:peroxiredoxin